jgi:hypothetical protein
VSFRYRSDGGEQQQWICSPKNFTVKKQIQKKHASFISQHSYFKVNHYFWKRFRVCFVNPKSPEIQTLLLTGRLEKTHYPLLLPTVSFPLQPGNMLVAGIPWLLLLPRVLTEPWRKVSGKGFPNCTLLRAVSVQQLQFPQEFLKSGVVPQTYHPSYSGGRD